MGRGTSKVIIIAKSLLFPIVGTGKKSRQDVGIELFP